MIRLAIIEDNRDIVKMLQLFFEKQKDFDLVFCAGSAEEIPMEKIDDVDIILCDIGLPGKSGVEVVREIRQKDPKAQIVMFTIYEEDKEIFQSLQAGASGYLLKDTPLLEIKQNLIEVLDGGAAIIPQLRKK